MSVIRKFRGAVRFAAVAVCAATLSGSGQPLFASGQESRIPAPQPAPTTPASLTPPVPPVLDPAAGPVLRMTVDEAVTSALEQNLGIRADRL
jgi:hypothetical protein